MVFKFHGILDIFMVFKFVPLVQWRFCLYQSVLSLWDKKAFFIAWINSNDV